ncbi:protein FAM47E-like [Ambystoma mexicanum]|uniref:protein FAM47E-like n=1 Tax=Ambystoma mexicanum TaxID=8296 RepID=UPI0037E88D8E
MAVKEQGQNRLWHKERVTNKYLKDYKGKRNVSGSLDSSRWQFLGKAAEDSRDGHPTQSDGICPGRLMGPSPVLHKMQKSTATAEKIKAGKRFTKRQVSSSVVLPLQQIRRNYVDEIEYGLTRHPLILYPHLEDGIPPELFEEIIDILDPEMHLRSESESCIASSEGEAHECPAPEQEEQEPSSVKTKDTSTKPTAISEAPKPRTRTPYRWPSVHEEVADEDRICRPKQGVSPHIPETVQLKTKEFCDWFRSLGGENYNIDEPTIFSLFASGYETKPALTVPIHVVELNNVPAELRRSVGVSKPHTALKASHSVDRGMQTKGSSYIPSWVKIRYGAWYLNPKLWKKLEGSNPFLDPHADDDTMSPESRTKLNQQDAELMELHGTIAFKEFIETKGYRNPEFLMKILAKRDATILEQRRNSRLISAKSKWFRSHSVSTHEESVVN